MLPLSYTTRHFCRTRRADDPMPVAVKPGEMSPVSLRMQLATQGIQVQAAIHPFRRDLRQGALPRDAFIQYLTDQHVVYGMLESMLRAGPAAVAALLPDSLRRAPALTLDLAAFGGAATYPSQAAQTYARHLKKLEWKDPVLLLAHAFARYTGDMAHARVLGQRVLQTYGVSLDFSDFGDFGAEPCSSEAWMRALDTVPLSAQQHIRMADEAELAIAFSIAMMTAAREFS